MEDCLNDIVDIIRRCSNVGFIKIKEEQEIIDSIKKYTDSMVLLEKEKAYNEGFLAGIKVSQRINNIN